MDYNFKGIFALLLISAIDMQLPHKVLRYSISAHFLNFFSSILIGGRVTQEITKINETGCLNVTK